ncbi:MAG: heavy metal-associated domain-containing protein [Thermodesulfobacteriota bacterium]
MQKKLLAVTLTALVILLAGLAHGRVSSLRVAVDGMACPFCAFGVEKRLKKVNGVALVTVDMKTGTATVTARPDASIRYQEVAKAVKDAGFTAGNIKIRVTGTIDRDSGGNFVLRFAGFSLPLKTDNNDLKAHFNTLAGSGKSIVLNGPLLPQGKEEWTFAPEVIEEAAP